MLHPQEGAENLEGASALAMDVLLTKRVQEMVLNGEDPPRPYICRDGGDDSEDVSSSSSPIPIIDLSLFSSPELETAQQELQKLKSALCSWGCFQAVGHGMTTLFLNEIRRVSKEFFEQPMEEKRKIAKGVEEFEGYGADPTPEEGQYLDWSDRLFLDVYPEDLRKYQFWPETPNSFRDVLENYTIKMKMVTETISKAMAQSLNLEENCFLNQFGERGTLQARFNYYSRCPKPDTVLGLKPHADGSGYTVILQNEVDGLQILKEDCWFTIPTISNALLVLMADQMEIMSNGIFKSPVHRVLASSERERISVAVFYTPESGKLIGPEEGLVDEERQRLFKKVKDYADIHWKYYQQGQRALHIAKA